LAARLSAQASCLPFACFESGIEGQAWQALTPFGAVDPTSSTPAVTVNSDGSTSTTTCAVNPAATHPADGVLCNTTTVSADMLTTTMTQGPPPLGDMLYPFDVTAAGQHIFVSDTYNERIQAFTFDGTPVALAHPIGNGQTGSGLQSLTAPQGLMIVHDQATGKNVLGVADTGNHRLAFFFVNTTDGTDGLPAFGNHYPLLFGGAPIAPSGLAASPGAQIQGLGAPVNGDSHRVIVGDGTDCYVYILDAGLNILKRIPATTPTESDPALVDFLQGQGACVAPSYDVNGQAVSPPLGYFGAVTGVAIDGSGNIFVADYDNSRIQILDPTGQPLGSFGTPPDPSTLPPDAPLPPGALQGPWGVMIDHQGRIAVTDSDNQRIAFFSADFSSGSPVVTFLFELDAESTLNGFPRGIVEQVGAAADGLDPAGRLIAVDTANHRIQRFQLPDLVIANAVLNPETSTTPAAGTFDVLVPAQKAATVLNVSASIQGTNALGGPLTLSPPADTAPQVDLAPGQSVTYNFPYSTSGTPVSFALDAQGNGGVTHAPQVIVTQTTPCTDCSSVASILNVSDGLPATLSNGWYSQQLNIQITATSSNLAGLASIAYQFTAGPAAAIYGGGTHFVIPDGGGNSPLIPMQATATSTLQYWAVNADGSVELPHHVLNVSLDLQPPTPAFVFPDPTGHDAGGAPWFRSAIMATVLWTDDLSGAATPSSTLTFSSEGRGQFGSVTGVDRAGNISLSFRSDLGPLGGRPVNIDTGAPTFTAAIQTPVKVELTGPGVGVLPANSAFQAWAQTPSLAASDPLLSTGAAGSGVVNIAVPAAGTAFPMLGAGPTTASQSITAKDGAGNTTAGFVSVVVQDTTPPTLSCPATPITVTLSGVVGVTTVLIPSVTPQATATDLSGSAMLAQSPLAASGSFGIGNHNVTVTASDQSGNTSTCTALVRVVDVTAPGITVPGPIAAEAVNASGAPVTYMVSAIDNVDLAPAVACAPVSGATFPLGSTTVNCSSTDAAGNTGTASFTVTVSDTTPPAITVPGAISAPAVNAAGAPVAYTVSATDNVDVAPSLACAPASGSVFGVGTTHVNCTVADSAGNSASAGFDVTVTDIPTISVPAPITLEATSAAGATASFAATWTDAVDGSGPATCLPASNSTFALGDSTVTCSYTNANGQTASQPFTVTVQDTTAPAITTPSPAPVEATGPNGATVTFTASSTDLASGSPAVSCTPASGSIFAVGTTPVTCTATDGAGNQATGTFDVVVRDTTSPILSLPASPFVVEATGPSGATVSYVVSATDAASAAVTVACTPAAGTTFPLGASAVNCTATDAHGNTATGSFSVDVRDTTPPAIVAPAGLTVGASSTSGAIVTYSVTATDLVSAATVSCVLPSGALFPIGTTGVVCTATDAAGNVATKDFPVTVTNVPPQLMQANIVATATNSLGAVVTFAPQVIDPSDPNPAVTCVPASGSRFPIGAMPVTCTAVNRLGLTGTVTFTVTVRHSVPVCVAAAPSISSLWPANHKLVPMTIKGLTTADGGTMTTVIKSIFQDEPTDGLGDGDTAIDGFGVGTSTGQLRAERSGNLDGRFYYVGFEATTAGGSCTGTVTVSVPHDQAHQPVAQGPLYDSTKVSGPGSSAKDDDHGKKDDDHGKKNDNRPSKDSTKDDDRGKKGLA